MVYLKLGKMTTKEICEWFGISYKTYTSKTNKYLEKLKYFADFERIYGGVIIKKIFLDYYCKGINKDDEFLLQEVERCEKEQEGLLSIAGVARLALATEERYKGLSFSQVKRRFSNAAKRQFGSFLDEVGGLKGFRKREWAIKLSDLNIYRPLTAEEQEIFYDLVKGEYNILKRVELDKDLIDEEIEIENYKEIVKQDFEDFYSKVINGFFKETNGGVLVLVGKYEMLAWNKLSEEDKEKLRKRY